MGRHQNVLIYRMGAGRVVLNRIIEYVSRLKLLLIGSSHNVLLQSYCIKRVFQSVGNMLAWMIMIFVIDNINLVIGSELISKA